MVSRELITTLGECYPESSYTRYDALLASPNIRSLNRT
jgi:hypothetical protein